MDDSYLIIQPLNKRLNEMNRWPDVLIKRLIEIKMQTDVLIKRLIK
ncbi:hypothetical protein KHA93_19520 [Bacillus sp. FJAT-49732]|uniref:Uncharacterized protein n=1 Tax=Lederbergia citrisecunda TaxID=2833583 RepID=A0A942YML6_9BACI|nr:hypothetical protein [Lederbergia citrisecunda]MBS4201797.1 hypothetical protein [Lederbergia citrisecunda]